MILTKTWIETNDYYIKYIDANSAIYIIPTISGNVFVKFEGPMIKYSNKYYDETNFISIEDAKTKIDKFISKLEKIWVFE